MTEKHSNPKDAVGIRKAYQSVLPLPVLYEVGLAMLEGALRYGRHNYRVIGVRASTYYDACRRHLDEWWEGQDLDRPTRIHNLSKAIACLLVLRDAEMRGMLTDDRPPKMDYDWLAGMNERAAELVSMYPNAEAAYTEKRNEEGRDEQRDDHPPVPSAPAVGGGLPSGKHWIAGDAFDHPELAGCAETST